MNWINTLNTTSFRIIGTVGLVYLTALRYMGSGLGFSRGPHVDPWVPSWEWLTFLTVMSGIEGGVLVAKRLTDYDYKKIAGDAKPKVNVETANVQAGDVSVQAPPIDVTSPVKRDVPRAPAAAGASITEPDD